MSDKSKPTEADPRIKELRGEAAALIRKYLWLSKTPPMMNVQDSRPWTMGRDLSMWNALVKEGNDPEEINGAITVVRKRTRIVGPMTMHIFYSNAGKTRPIFEQCKSAWLSEQDKKPKRFVDVLKEIVADG